MSLVCPSVHFEQSRTNRNVTKGRKDCQPEPIETQSRTGAATVPPPLQSHVLQTRALSCHRAASVGKSVSTGALCVSSAVPWAAAPRPSPVPLQSPPPLAWSPDLGHLRRFAAPGRWPLGPVSGLIRGGAAGASQYRAKLLCVPFPLCSAGRVVWSQP